MTKKLIILSIAVLMLVSFHVTLSAKTGQRRHHKMMRHARFGIMMAEKNLFPAFALLKHKEEIGLTQEQVTKIEKMQELHQETFIRKQADIKVKELKFNSFMKQDQINRSKMEKMIREIAKMKTDVQISHINYLLDLKNLLTPEQVQKLEEFKRERMHQRMDKRKHRMKERMEKRERRHE
jgi:Spy/CpxP family protein refolding chaperone